MPNATDSWKSKARDVVVKWLSEYADRLDASRVVNDSIICHRIVDDIALLSAPEPTDDAREAARAVLDMPICGHIDDAWIHKFDDVVATYLTERDRRRYEELVDKVKRWAGERYYGSTVYVTDLYAALDALLEGGR